MADRELLHDVFLLDRRSLPREIYRGRQNCLPEIASPVRMASKRQALILWRGKSVSGVLKRLRSGLSDESGQALVLVAVAMAVILGLAGIVVDVGQLHYTQSRLQAAADAAAVSGALEIAYCGGTSNCALLQAAAQKALAENGLAGSTLVTQCATGTGSGLTLTVNNGPCNSASDPNYGNTNYVEALVSEPQPTYFIRILGITSTTLTARAEATIGNLPFCVDTLGSSGTTFQNNGGTLTASCGILVNSTGSHAFVSNGGTVTASAIDVSGGDQITGGSVTPTPITNSPGLPDPLSWVPTPTIGGCTYSAAYVVNTTGSVTLNPGNYCGGIIVNSGAATFSPGLYTLGGSGLLVNGGSMSGNGTTFYFQAGSAVFNGTSSINLVAPTTGTYAGILFFQNSSDASAATINGGAGSVFQGALYFPHAPVQLNGGNVAAYTIVVSQSVQMNGSSFNIGNDYSSLPGGSPAKGVTAVLAE
jgi:Flp pilus assembly protein TadG